VALDHWVARHVLFPIDGNIRHDPGHDNIQAWLEPAEKLINARGGLYHPEWGIHAGAVTRDESRMIVHSALAEPLPRLTLAAPNGGELWERGSLQEIAWSHAGDPGRQLEILLLDGPRIQAVLAPAALLHAGSLRCRVPADTPQGRNYRVRIRSLQYPELSDESDRPFAVVPELPGGRRPQGPR
jgi:hypothetical protein